MIYSTRPWSPTALQWGQYRMPILETYDSFYVRAKLDFSPTHLPIEPGATLKRMHTLSPKTHMRLDHFGHNYEFSVTALPDHEDVSPRFSSSPARLFVNVPNFRQIGGFSTPFAPA